MAFCSSTKSGSNMKNYKRRGTNNRVRPEENSTIAEINAAETKFRQAQEKLQESVKKHLDKDLDSSSEEEDLNSKNILDTVLSSYISCGVNAGLEKTITFLEDIFQSGSAVCLICIATVKRAESIWSCNSCYAFYHLNCIQRWGKDNIAHQKFIATEKQTKNAKFFWHCPKCRKEYDVRKIPNKYVCFCTKQLEPAYHPWLIPHSCGEICDKLLTSNCGHRCLLLCHPGPCPPCPKMVSVNCYCCKMNPKAIRCYEKGWSCGQQCNKPLICGSHKCLMPCHPGQCGSCTFTSEISCNCKEESKMIPCSQLSWHCEKICNKLLNCNLHVCEIVCHSGLCDECPRSLPRSCPCGKTMQTLSCQEDVNTCGDTCGKLLLCGMHYCSSRCHRGLCGACMEIRVKNCRCGLHSKEILCSKEYLCDAKCKNLRDCGLHLCNKKCCDGSCPSCEKICARTLRCGMHKCTSICHRGPCYPCQEVKKIFCACGQTNIIVPCGKRSHPPKCTKLCREPSDCHHPTRRNHKCHFGPCPPCAQICKKQLPCQHFCSEICHTAVLVNVNPDFVPATPWEKMISNSQVEIQNIPCAPCNEEIDVKCFGLHEIRKMPCHLAAVSSCGRKCDRLLDCTRHKCEIICHPISKIAEESGLNDENECEVCDRQCTLKRLCEHECSQVICHQDNCLPCATILRFRCHCNLIQQFIKCHTWYTASESEKNDLLCCGNQCPKEYEQCGHRCLQLCHKGNCTGADNCNKKVKLSCPCKRLKKEFRCFLVATKKLLVECDEECIELLSIKQKEVEREKTAFKEAEEARNRADIEWYEKKFQIKKNKKKKAVTENKNKKSNFFTANKPVTIIIITTVVLIAFLFTFWNK